MATFFGEVVPEFSRAVDEDEDIDEESIVTTSSVLRWSPDARREIKQNGCLRCGVLLIAIGPAATGFADTYVLETQGVESLGVICSGVSSDKEISTLSQQAPTDNTCYIYRLRHKRDVLLVQCKADIPPEQAFSFTEMVLGKDIKLLPAVSEPEQPYVAVLCSRPAAEHQSEEAIDDQPFMRAIRTTGFHGTPLAPYLQPPNMVQGLPAQVMSYCQVHGLAAVMYVCFTDAAFLDIEAITAFKALLQATPVRDVVEENPKAAAHMAKLVEQHNRNNTLYI